MGETKQRKSPRLRVALSVQVLGARRSVGLTTVDVSHNGLFLHTKEPWPERQLLRLHINVGAGRDPISGHGMVVRVVDEEEAARTSGEPGMGVEFYGFGGEPRRRWDGYLQQLATAPGIVASVSATRRVERELQPVLCEAAHRMRGRSRVLLLLDTSNVEQLHEICNHYLPAAMVPVHNAPRLEPGTAVDLRLTHPLSRDVYDLTGSVRKIVESPPFLEIGLTSGRSTRQEELREFIKAGLPDEELSLDVVDEDKE